jgi:ABC-2 type transport system ATP-binding protein
VQVRGLRKAFGDRVVLDGVDLDIAEGTVFALLGANGAGKTTTVRILSTQLPADGGEIAVAGFDLRREPNRVRGAIGVTGQLSAVDNLLTGEENLLLVADLRHLDRRTGRRRAAELLERFELTDAARRTVATYSGGMRRRLDLAMTLVGQPQLVFLDEPTTGLDPRSRRTMWEIVRELVGEGVTILLTPQQLDEADERAGRVALLDSGRVVAEGTPDELKRRIPGGQARLSFRDAVDLDAAARALGASGRDDEALVLTVPTDDTADALRDLLARLDGVAVDRIAVHTPDLDDVFLALTGASGDEREAR